MVVPGTENVCHIQTVFIPGEGINTLKKEGKVKMVTKTIDALVL